MATDSAVGVPVRWMAAEAETKGQKTMSNESEKLIKDAMDEMQSLGIDNLRAKGAIILLSEALRRAETARDAALKQSAGWEIQAQDMRDRLIKAESERDAQHALVLRLTGERDEAKADAVRMLTAASQQAITNARLAADRDEASVVHACPPKGSGVMPCCVATAFEKPGDRLTTNAALVTCNQQRRVAELTATRDLLTAENARLQMEVATLRFLHNGGH